MWGLTIIAAIALGQAAPSAEAEDLGLRLAKSGALSVVLPIVLGKERDELLAEQTDWTVADKAALADVAKAVGDAALGRLLAAIGHRYAETLPVEDLRALVAFNEGPAAARWRQAEPAALMGAVQGMGGFDFKNEVRKAMCAKTGKLCGE
jgi:hypothetical protein